jgi:DNA-directed RNA polymerase subunit RPC12/RpoP
MAPNEQDEDKCTECGARLDDGEGYDGLCGNCADRRAAKEEQP